MTRLTLRIDFGASRAIGPGKIRLLELIAETGSISAAGRAMAMSYRRAWLLVDTLNQTFQSPVVETRGGGTGGGGASLTQFGVSLIEDYRTMEHDAHAAVANRPQRPRDTRKSFKPWCCGMTRYGPSNITAAPFSAGRPMTRTLPTLAAAMFLLPALAHATDVNVLYAGSLVNLMEHGIGPAFDKATGDQFRGFGGGSTGLANQIKGKLRRGDVFISASPKADDILMGSANGDWVDYYITFAKSPLVIGYNPNSKFAADLKTKPWYEVLREPGIRIGRTDPKLDPKGALTVQLLD
jgi:molybdate transport repressor ModE-like protein